MTYEDAIEALIAAQILNRSDQESAVAALTSTRTEYTYPGWARALAEAGLIQSGQIEAAADIMQQVERQLDARDEHELDQGLENAGLL